jgi:hypothetical protein
LKGDIPADQTELVLAFEKTAAVLRERFKARFPERFKNYALRLRSLAKLAFNHDNVQLGFTARALEEFKAEIVRSEGSLIKHENLTTLGVYVLWACAFIVVLAGAAQTIIGFFGHQSDWIAPKAANAADAVGKGDQKPEASTDQQGKAAKQPYEQMVVFSTIHWDSHFSVPHYAILLIGSMFGIWVSFSVKNMQLTFEQLQNIDADLMKPWLRLMTFGMLALILALFFHFRVVVVAIGDSFSTSRISDDAILAFLVGLCLGFSDKVLPTEVQTRVKDFFSRARTS